MKDNHKRWVVAGAAAIALFIIVLWSWNTLAALFGFPDARAKHVLAALLLLGTLRYAAAPRFHRLNNERARHGHETR